MLLWVYDYFELLKLRFSLDYGMWIKVIGLLLLNLKLSRIAGQIASRMKYLRNAGKFAECGTITQNAGHVATLIKTAKTDEIDVVGVKIKALPTEI